jgi:hypothetical protein
VYIDGILKYSGISLSLPHSVMVTSCKMKFFAIKKICNSMLFVHTTPWCHSLSFMMMMHKTDIPLSFNPFKTTIFTQTWHTLVSVVSTFQCLSQETLYFLAASQLFVCLFCTYSHHSFLFHTNTFFLNILCHF